MQKQNIPKSITLTFDHIAIAAETLEEGVEYVRDCLGVDIPKGGEHPKMGTHNHLMRLGENEFLEVIAVNPTAQRPKHPRWFDLDKFKGKPRIGNWILRCDILNDAIHHFPKEIGPATRITRGDLSWRITIPEDGSLPYKAAFPTLMQWDCSPLPANNMANRNCTLEKLIILHPKSEEIEMALSSYFNDPRIIFRTAETISLTAEIQTPEGLRQI